MRWRRADGHRKPANVRQPFRACPRRSCMWWNGVWKRVPNRAGRMHQKFARCWNGRRKFRARFHRRDPLVPGIPWAVALSALILAGIIGVLWALRRAGILGTNRPVRHPTEAHPGNPQLGENDSVAVSLDGKLIAYTQSGNQGVAFRRLDNSPLPPVGGGNRAGAFLSPDSEWVGFVAFALGLMRAPVKGRPLNCPSSTASLSTQVMEAAGEAITRSSLQTGQVYTESSSTERSRSSCSHPTLKKGNSTSLTLKYFPEREPFCSPSFPRKRPPVPKLQSST